LCIVLLIYYTYTKQVVVSISKPWRLVVYHDSRLLLSKLVGAYFFFHGSAGRAAIYYNVLLLYGIPYAICWYYDPVGSRTTPARLIIDGIDYRTFSPPLQHASPWATVLFIYRAPRISAARLVKNRSRTYPFARSCRRHGVVPAVTDVSTPNDWRRPNRIAVKWPPRWVDVCHWPQVQHLSCLCAQYHFSFTVCRRNETYGFLYTLYCNV